MKKVVSKKVTLKTKNILFVCGVTILVAILLTGVNYFMGSESSLNQLASDSTKTVEAWSGDVLLEDVEKLMETKDIESEESKKLIEHFNDLSKYQPQVAQGYLFGTELVNGTDTSIIAGPTFLMDDFASGNLHVGDMYTQPDNIAKAISEMLETRDLTVSETYTDDFGTWITVLKPLFNSNGDIFAYYGVDFNAKTVIDNNHKEIIISIIITVALLIVVTVIQYLFVTKTFKPIEALKDAIEKASEFDFTTKLKESNDEFGQLGVKFNNMSSKISQLLSTIKVTSKESTASANTLFDAVKESGKAMDEITQEVTYMADRFSTQNASTEEVLHSLREMSTGVDVIARNASEVSNLSIDTRDKAQAGNDSVESVKVQMQKIDKSTKHSEEIITSLKHRSDEISTIVQLITDIADQTNLLSLNAAIEAARAGEHGKGFAVVADEVRKLAEQSRSSAKQIEDLIKHIQSETDKAVTSINDESLYVKEGVKLVEEAKEIFSDILEATSEVSARLQEVSASTEEMAAENEEVTSTFEQLTTISIQNGETIESITQSISEQQASLESIIDSSNSMSKAMGDLDELVSSL